MSKETDTCEVRTRIPKSVYKDLTEYAYDSGLSVNEAVKQLILTYVENKNAMRILETVIESEKTTDPEKIEETEPEEE